MRSISATPLWLAVAVVFVGMTLGCKPATLSSLTGKRTVTSTATYTVAPEVHETPHLPAGVRIQVREPREGVRASVFSLVSSAGIEQTGALVSEKIVSEASPGEIWAGTGSRSAATVKYLKIGTKYNDTSDWVTDDTSTIDAAAGTVVTSSRLVSPKRGAEVVYVHLGPQATEMIGEPMVAGGTGWFDSYTYWNADSGTGSVEPTGTWIAIVEIDQRPAIWRTFEIR
ncbi:MAG: hypothetical protein FDZ70_08285 [Actinobacteria bacterium]|nr:MAG: hypothetical protein FDZ70_08285 [Actinomycetota bacterium]